MYQLICWNYLSHNNVVRSWRISNVSTFNIKTRFKSGGNIGIGNIKYALKKTKFPEKVPVKYAPSNKELSQSVLQHLKWIMQKDHLGQDIFLIGPPGSLRRTITMQYLELTQREAEYVSLSRDTTESDLKQRREINNNTSYYFDQSSVRAAMNGRVLILDGIEKAERNVLPVLNNLLENREMQLDDGRFLVSAKRYDSLLEKHSKEQLDKLKLIRVSEDFRVFALGLPIPRYPGNTLDPPLRSRFQSRNIAQFSYKESLESLEKLGVSKISKESIANILSFAYTLQSLELMSLGMPDFPIENLKHIITMLDCLPHSSYKSLLNRLYPQQLFLNKEGQDTVKETLKTFDLDDTVTSPYVFNEVRMPPNDQAHPIASVVLKSPTHKATIAVPCGSEARNVNKSHTQDFVMTEYHSKVLSDMFQSHLVKDFCLIGPKGCGKTVLVHQFAELLGYEIEPLVIYQDMTSRDLLQQRTTLANGDTVWRPSPLIVAALNGHLAVLDGIHRSNQGTLSVLQRLITDREITLYDNTQLLRHDRYELIKKTSGLTDQELKKRKVFPIHPSFRIIAVAEPPLMTSNSWLGSELLSLFLYHHIEPLSKQQEAEIIYNLVPGVPSDKMGKFLNLAETLRRSDNSLLSSISSSLSTRQLLRIAKKLAMYHSEDLYEIINRACLTEYLPSLAITSLEKEISDVGITKLAKSSTKASIIDENDGHIKIGDTNHEVFNAENQTKVPSTLFYDNVQHIRILEEMLKDFRMGEHLLLVGNQGVGKNKVVDKFLQLLNRPREYIQLHRDTTVQTLTLQPTVQNCVIVYEDSPLVQAVKYGHVLVIDEADKAPINVTCILKTLIENGEMILGDGRRIVPAGTIRHPLPEDIIEAHKDFRVIVLANRPGFPFLGNDFFGAMGDIFSCHAIVNPDRDSEMSLLKQYGPDVPQHVLEILVDVFSELRVMADQGQIAYPYSTREVVNIVKHLQMFPNDGLAQVVCDVFDFDSYNTDVQKLLISTLRKNGIPFGVSANDVHLAKQYPLPSVSFVNKWYFKTDEEQKCDFNKHRITMKKPIEMNCPRFDIDRHESRSSGFSELLSEWKLPLYESSKIVDVAVGAGSSLGDWVHIATTNPMVIYSMQSNQDHLLCMDLFQLFPYNFFNTPPQVQITPLSGNFKGKLIFYEKQSNTMLLLDPSNNQVQQMILKPQTFGKYISNQLAFNKETYNLFAETGEKNRLVLAADGGNVLNIIEFDKLTSSNLSLPFLLDKIHFTSDNYWLLTEKQSNNLFRLSFNSEPDGENISYSLTPTHIESCVANDSMRRISKHDIPDSILKLCKEWWPLHTYHGEQQPTRLTAGKNYAGVLISNNDEFSSKSFFTFERSDYRKEMDGNSSLSNPLCLENIGQVVRTVPSSFVPSSDTEEDKSAKEKCTHYLEIVDIGHKSYYYLPVTTESSSQITNNSKNIFINALSNDTVVSVTSNGSVRLWETGTGEILKSLEKWRTLVGEQNTNLQITHERDSGLDVSGPKHGKVDANNEPHVGGNTWAGGTGGRDTAGLGGKGGPYRLDAGHDVFQISQEEKDAVPDEVKRAAREMGRKAFKDRLEEINMSEYEAEIYEKFSSRVSRQVQSLRVVIESIQSKGKERNWLRHQTTGDLDDAKLIDGLTGEKAIYKRRADHEPEPGSLQQLPKQLRIVVDVSGSMYRFNGLDQRLQRMMEASCLVMEAFDKYENKFKYDIIGHSGEDPEILFVSQDAPPVNNKQRLQILQSMHAHAQFCISGDYTLEATKRSIKEITNRKADEYFVIIFSDANLRRYGITSSAMKEALKSNPNVKTFIMFIGSLGNEAERLSQQLPAGQSFVCMETKNIPEILQQIFSTTVVN